MISGAGDARGDAVAPPHGVTAVTALPLKCPQADSNRHCADFKSAASANWAMGASEESSVSTAAPPGYLWP